MVRPCGLVHFFSSFVILLLLFNVGGILHTHIYNTQDLEMLWDDSILFGMTRAAGLFGGGRSRLLPEHIVVLC